MIIYCGDYTYLQPFYSLSELYAKILNNNALKICAEKKKHQDHWLVLFKSYPFQIMMCWPIKACVVETNEKKDREKEWKNKGNFNYLFVEKSWMEKL